MAEAAEEYYTEEGWGRRRCSVSCLSRSWRQWWQQDMPFWKQGKHLTRFVSLYV